MIGRRSNGGGVNKYKIIDIDGSELSISNLIERYFFSENHHISCSVIETKYYNNIIEESSIVDVKSEATEEDDKIGQHPKELRNSFIDDSKDIVTSNSCSSYKYTIEDIDKFFASDFEYHKEHSLEDSIC